VEKHDTDEESKMSDGPIVNDTSDVITSDTLDTPYATHKGSIVVNEKELDPYQKIKIHANLALRNLLKNNSNIILNYWYILFPSFMMRPQSEFKQYLYKFESNEKVFTEKSFALMDNQEPTLFFVIRQPQNQSQLRSSMYATLQVLLENANFHRFQMDLETEGQSQQ